MSSHLHLRRWLKRLVKIFLIFFLVITVVITSGIVVIEIQRHQTIVLPTPTGPYAVGRMEYDWTDQSRIDTLAPHAGTKRELLVWVWYPAARVPGAQPASYLPSKWGQLIDQQRGSIGQQLLRSYNTIKTHSFDDAPLATNKAHYPMLIFEPGLGNIPTQYTTLIEDIVSHGYIVFAITPTYSSDVVVFPDGRVADATFAGKPDENTNLQAAGNRLIKVWSQDEIFVMNQLDRLNAAPGDMWIHHLDLTRLGIFGHSFGGATAAQVCHMDARCKAGIDIDGDLSGDVVQTGLDKPFMVIQHDIGTCSDTECRTFQQEIQAILRTVPRGASYNISVKDTEHFNFSDYAVGPSPVLHALGVLGSIDGMRGLQITRAYVLAFFDTYLNDTPSLPLQGPSSAYPEVRFYTP